jgi:hypothetical protein
MKYYVDCRDKQEKITEKPLRNHKPPDAQVSPGDLKQLASRDKMPFPSSISFT